jgi:hypothetical protein
VQPTDLQVEKSLRALEEGPPTDRAHGLGPVSAPAGIVELLAVAPAIRLDRMVDARMLLAAGMGPTDDDLASRMVGRLVCDRLR